MEITCVRGGSIRVPGTPLRRNVTIEPCGPGTEPSGLGGVRCRECAPLTYARGGDGRPCKSCPDELGFASCIAGVLQIPSSGWYLHEDDVSSPVINSTTGERDISSASEFHECMIPSACTIDVSTRVFRCAEGYMGPLCAICDSEAGYAPSSTPGECVRCGPPAGNWAIVSLGGLGLLLGLIYVAVLKRPSRNPRSIAFKIGINYVTALGSLGLFKAKGTDTFRSLVGWSETIGSSMFAGSSIQCVVQPAFHTVFFTAVAFPVVISGIAILLNAIAFALEAACGVQIRRTGASMCKNCACSLWQMRCVGTSDGDSDSSAPPTNVRSVARGLSTTSTQQGSISYVNPLHTSLHAAPVSRPTRPALGSDARAAPPSKSSPEQVQSGLHSSLIEYFTSFEFVSSAVLVVCLSYAVVCSMALSVFDCLPNAIGGRHLLKRDLRVECGSPEHVQLQAGAIVLLTVLGLGLPASIFIWMSRASYRSLERDENFFALYGYIFMGYDSYRRLQWWEAVVMVKKLMIVAVGSLVSDSYTAVLSAISVTVLALVLHALSYPFKDIIFNRLELLCLSSLAVTQVLSVVYLRGQDVALQSSADMEASGSAQDASIQSNGTETASGSNAGQS